MSIESIGDSRTKVCKDCGRELPIYEFYRHGTSYQSRCKRCYSAHQIKYREQQREKKASDFMTTIKKRKFKNPEAHKAKIASRYTRDFHNIPEEHKKIDLFKPVSVSDELISQQAKREEKLYPLRIDKRTVILVSADKCNDEYADRIRNRQVMTKK